MAYQAFFCALEKKLSRQKNSRFGKKLMVLAKKLTLPGFDSYRVYKENKKTQKNPKKNSEYFRKNSRYQDLTVIKSRKSAQKKSLGISRSQ